MAGFRLPNILPEIPDQPIGITYLGTPIWSSLIFKETKIENPDVDPSESESIQELELVSVVMTVEKRKQVIVTKVTNRVGDVKEFISDGDYQVRVQGAIVSQGIATAPRQEAELLDAHLSLGQTLEVASSFLDIFGIESVVILDYSISEVPEYSNQYDFSINMVSDQPIELEVKREEANQ